MDQREKLNNSPDLAHNRSKLNRNMISHSEMKQNPPMYALNLKNNIKRGKLIFYIYSRFIWHIQEFQKQPK